MSRREPDKGHAQLCEILNEAGVPEDTVELCKTNLKDGTIKLGEFFEKSPHVKLGKILTNTDKIPEFEKIGIRIRADEYKIRADEYKN